MKNYFFHIVFAALIPIFAACGDGNDFFDSLTPSLTKVSTTSADGVEQGHQWVDLGLSVMWATMNVGATSETDYGNYYAWGETETKSDYSWDTYKYGSSANTLTKYCTKSNYGSVDYLTQLELSDDVAHVKWGGSWRMPTEDEFKELEFQCTWTWAYSGYVVVGPSGKSIFLPVADYDYGSYWSSSLNESAPDYGRVLSCSSGYHDMILSNRYGGRSVRPVTE